MSMYYDSHAMGRVADAGEGKGGGAQGIGTVRVSLAYRMGRVQSGSLRACVHTSYFSYLASTKLQVVSRLAKL